ncbi:HAMP domain-containing protein [Streptomyces sp. WAC05374]|uniref:nitrate- and nitrite sensing domain-containing protein n=1 Tax=Streptomyces sp. WAC05374 TaxID=2487420 RepID=UPI000F8848FD|nr:nitrate- and nitrite sensing domain-containing protein [Streptomyces sp. WAC05374]RST06391.1 HAMP domain-containing protein [Streptomyces sp. WAC05374]TDF35917.1 HAMP domain-containing protein [Streptomyces sp. WAC05374]TDF44515.1 HAMP domain-containing protein [Streptomyces sp. WAC05374]TDF45573.1 HAMP domain-containing protein [Streptomyces sp. WAC05374]
MRRSTKSAAEQQARGNFTPPARTAVPPADTPGTPPAASGGSGGSGSSSKLSPRNWRVATRLNAILLVPVLVGLVMGGFQVKTSIDTWQEAQDAEKTALIVRAASEYGQALLNERDLTAVPLLTNKGRDDADVVKAYAATAAAKEKFDAAVQDMPSGQGLERRLEQFRAKEPDLDKLRQGAYSKALDPVQTEEGYVQVQHYLMEFSNELGLGTGNVTSYGRMVYAIQLAQAAGSLQRSIGTHLLVRPSKDDATYAAQTRAFNSYNYLEQIALGEFNSGGTEEDVAKLEAVMKRRAVEGDERLKAAGITLPKDERGSVLAPMAKEIGNAEDADAIKELKAKGIAAPTWLGASTSKFDGYGEVSTDLVNKAVDEAAEISADAKTDAIVNGAIVVVALLAAFILAGMMARQMSTSMSRLRSAAFGIAEQRLPMLVDQLSRTDPGRVDTRVQPIPIDSQDEIGEVARAFDQVHREAVRLAAEQALLRGNVNAIFTNLSQRNQSLIEGQLTLITELENNEADPDQLENLFRLDHLATRMRRNGENLLILAGEEPGRRWNQPVPLVDVLRAASSEVEQYERIELTGVPESEIHGQAVTDLVHLLAELLENATTFSSPQTKVRVTATRLPDGRVMIEIHDKGIGLTAEDFADINHKLANPPTVDAAISQRMGLFVVGRLADRHGIRVQLRPSGEQAGTTSLVMLPDAITHGGGGDPAMQDDFTVSQIIPEQQAFEAAPLRTAAELGFDDSRYEQQTGEGTTLDPVNRSRMREERRAALGAQLQGGADADRPMFRDEVAQEQHAPAYEQQGQQEQYGYEQEQYDQQAGYAQDGYEGYDQQQPAYDQQQAAYDQYGAGEYPTGEYAEPGYAESGFPAQETQQPQYDSQFDAQSHQGEWTDQASYEGGYASGYGAESESSQGAPANGPERVGFSSGPTPSTGHELTDAGLPRRGSQQKAPAPQQQVPQAEQTQPVQRVSQSSSEDSGSEGWRSTNDERWQRAEKLREPKAGGVTPSGLPRRVPKANLIEGTAEQTPQGGPQVSRAPEDVRGRLSNLRRGVQQGRNAGTDTNGSGLGPGSTYNQER